MLAHEPALAWADNLLHTACRVPGYEGHGGSIPDAEKAEEERCRIVSTFVEHGADPSMRNKHKVTPLHKACRYGLSRLADHLIALGAEVDAIDVVKEDASISSSQPRIRAVCTGVGRRRRRLQPG